MHNIDFSEPRWLLNYYHVIGFTSLVLNSLGIYLLIFQNSKLGNFRYYLLILQVACTLTDIHLSFLMQPVPLYPLLAGYTVGILSNYLDISTHICALIAGFIALVQLESLTLCFGKKHQAIASILKVHIVPNPILYSCYALCLICPFGLCASLQYLYMTHDEQLNYIEKNLPELLHDFSTLSHFVIYVKSPNLTWLYILVFTGGSTLFVLFVLFISDIFRLMRELKLKISISTYQKHHEALHSLMVQFATSILCLAPPCILVIIVYFEIENGKVIAESLIAWFASHSSVNMISLCLFFPPYRKFFWRSLNRNRKKITAGASSMMF